MKKVNSLRAKIQRCTAVFLMAVLFVCLVPCESNLFVPISYATSYTVGSDGTITVTDDSDSSSSSDSSSGSSSSSSGSSSSSSSSEPDPVGYTDEQLDAIAEMANNSAAWWMAEANGDTELMEELHAANEALAEVVADGGSANYDSSDGTWSITDTNDNTVTSSSSSNNKNTTSSYEINQSTGDKSVTSSQTFTADSIEAFKDAGGTSEAVIDAYNTMADIVASTNDYGWTDETIAQVALAEASIVQEAMGLTDAETAALAAELEYQKKQYESLENQRAEAILAGNTDLADSLLAEMEAVHEETQEIRDDYGYSGDMLGYEDGGFYDPFSFDTTDTYSSSSSGGTSTTPDPDLPEDPVTAPDGSFNINSYAEKGGYISPLDNTTVEQGKNQSYKFVAYDGYALSDIVVDGTSVFTSQYTSTYTFSNVQADHTIVVSFAESESTVVVPPTITVKEYNINSGVGAGLGTITPEGDTTVLHGRNQSYLLTPAEGYRISDVLVDGVSVIDDVVRADDSYYNDMVDYNEAYDEYLVNQSDWEYYNQAQAEYDATVAVEREAYEEELQAQKDVIEAEYDAQIADLKAQRTALTEAYENGGYDSEISYYSSLVSSYEKQIDAILDEIESEQSAIEAEIAKYTKLKAEANALEAELEEEIEDWEKDDCPHGKDASDNYQTQKKVNGPITWVYDCDICGPIYEDLVDQEEDADDDGSNYYDKIKDLNDELDDIEDDIKDDNNYDSLCDKLDSAESSLSRYEKLQDSYESSNFSKYKSNYDALTAQIKALQNELADALEALEDAFVPSQALVYPPNDTITEPIEPTTPDLPSRDITDTAKAPDEELVESAGGFQELEQGMYTFYNVTDNHTIVVEFESASYVQVVDVALYDYKDRDVGTIKSGYGLFTDVQVYYDFVTDISVTATCNYGSGNTVTALSETSVGVFAFPINSTSTKNYRCIYVPVEAPDQDYTIDFTITATGIDGETITDTLSKTFTVNGNMYEDDFSGDS